MPGELAVSNRVIMRDNFGRFRRECELAMGETIKQAVEDGAQLSRDLAPVGHKRDPRTTKLKDSITAVVVSRTQGYWQASARHALAQELGAAPHEIPGEVHFFWEREGRWWEPGTNTINHPGNAAQPYLRPAYQAIMNRIMSIAKRYYP